MDLATLALFLPACFALNMAPGPNNLLSVSNATRYGYRASCLAGIGRLLAFAGMIALASAGLAVVLQRSCCFTGSKLWGPRIWFIWRFNYGAPIRKQSLNRRRRKWDCGRWRVRSFWWRRATQKPS